MSLAAEEAIPGAKCGERRNSLVDVFVGSNRKRFELCGAVVAHLVHMVGRELFNAVAKSM